MGVNLGQMFENTQHTPTLDEARGKIDAYYARGFRNLRIPVTWTEEVDGSLLVHDPSVGEGLEVASGRLPAGHYVEILVADDGAGIDASVLPRVFEPFFTTKGESGTGLGLASVRHLACRCGGGVSIDSQVGAGTRVSVFLPLAEQKESPTSM